MGRLVALAAALAACAAAALAACAAPTTAPAPQPLVGTGPVARSLDDAADLTGVPADLLTAIAVEEGGVKLAAHRVVIADDDVPVAGAFELRHGRLDTLGLGAKLTGATADQLRADTDLGTRAGALVIAELGREHGARPGDLASWRPAVEALSGMDDADARAYANRVFAILRVGGDFAARDGETVHVLARADAPLAQAPLVQPYDTPDYPGAIWFTTSCTNKCDVGRPLGNASVNKIVIHDTEGGWDGSVATLQNDAGKSVHYIVDADGSRVGQFRPETDTTWHAGNYYYNETSIGIEHVGVASDPSGYSDGLYATSRALVASIRTRWSVPLDRAHIVGHYQVPDGNVIAEDSPPCDGLDACETSANYGGADHHRDPGYYWQWCQYMEALGGTCTCADTWPLWNCTTDGKETWRCDGGTVEKQDCTTCDVQPIGQDDVCHVVSPPDGGGSGGSDIDAGVGSGSGPDAGGSGSPDSPENVHAGCAGGGGGGSLGLALALAFVIVTRRRRP